MQEPLCQNLRTNAFPNAGRHFWPGRRAARCWNRHDSPTCWRRGGAHDTHASPCPLPCLGPLQEARGRAPRGAGALTAGHRDAGTPGRPRAACLTAWGIPERRTDLMNTDMQRAEAVRQACIAAALQAYDDAGVSGLCHEGRWECAVDAMRALPLRPLVQALLLAAEDKEGGGLPS